MNHCRESLSKKTVVFLTGACLLFLSSCSVKINSNIDRKFSPDEITKDLTVLRTTYEEAHPSLYWYTSKDSINTYFNNAFESVKDSMTEPELYKLIAYTISPIHCGHTSVKYSKGTAKFLQADIRSRIPVELRFVGDTALITLVYDRKDSVLKFGMEVKSINRIPVTTIRDSLFKFMSSDGYNTTVKYARLNGNFASFHRLVYGLYDKYEIEYLDREGKLLTTLVRLYEPMKDSTRRNFTRTGPPPTSPPPSELERLRRFSIDTANSTATMTITTFENKARLIRFIKRSFRLLSKKGVKNLIIDLRTNGGGNLSRSALLGKYIAEKPFRVSDTAFAVKRSGFSYPHHIEHKFFYWIAMNFLTHKKSDGKYHFGYLENHVFAPRKRNHFNGNVYVLTAGATFSASTLFINHVKDQPNVKIVGEETGGGYYGSSAINIPDLTLPNTKIRVRLPLYRLVMAGNHPKTGRGFFPDYYVPVTTESLRKRFDAKMEFVKKLIAAGNH